MPTPNRLGSTAPESIFRSQEGLGVWEHKGKVAAVGGRMVRGAARQLIDRFLRGLIREAGGEAGTAPPGGLSGRLRRLVGGKA